MFCSHRIWTTRLFFIHSCFFYFYLFYLILSFWFCIYSKKFSHLIVHIYFLFICYQIEIKELDDFAQAAFRGFKYLNRIQSRIFDTVYNTNENILVSYFLSIFGKHKLYVLSFLLWLYDYLFCRSALQQGLGKPI